MKEDFKWDGIDENASFIHSLASTYKTQMWQDITKHIRENPSLVKLRKGDKVIGKVMMVSTVDEPKGNQSLKNIWEDSDKPNGLFKIFRPALNELRDENKDV